VNSHELAQERLVLVLATEHPRARRKRLRLADLADETFVDFPFGSAGRAQTDRAFSQAGIARDVAYEVTDVALMAALIRRGLAIGFVPAPYVRIASELDRLVTVEVRDAPQRTEFVAWASPGPSPATAEFLATIGVRPTSA
jgi:DNA-binding transcriptional LysR family regulator